MQLRFYILTIGLLLAEIWPRTSQKADLGSIFLIFYGMWGGGLLSYLVPGIRSPQSHPCDGVFSEGSEKTLQASNLKLDLSPTILFIINYNVIV